ncbi:hypothetical protein JOB18_023136 [Solea senegalensis]|uniref:Uncharacterized protein n=1 Tax=Solea senegalensis TaxID=28829 RepID=A0AAV6SKU3_SOLSE|nr:hypothetical protein JOB18_023136 [Solea senegalensis]
MWMWPFGDRMSHTDAQHYLLPQRSATLTRPRPGKENNHRRTSGVIKLRPPTLHCFGWRQHRSTPSSSSDTVLRVMLQFGGASPPPTVSAAIPPCCWASEEQH